jgi:hypothetical protein
MGMKRQQQDFEVVPYSKLQRVMALTLRSAQRKPMIHGLIEVDVTKVRAFLREHKAKTEESLSFTAMVSTSPRSSRSRPSLQVHPRRANVVHISRRN